MTAEESALRDGLRVEARRILAVMRGMHPESAVNELAKELFETIQATRLAVMTEIEAEAHRRGFGPKGMPS